MSIGCMNVYHGEWNLIEFLFDISDDSWRPYFVRKCPYFDNFEFHLRTFDTSKLFQADSIEATFFIVTGWV